MSIVADGASVNPAKAKELGLALLNACCCNDERSVALMLTEEPERLFFATAVDLATGDSTTASKSASVHSPLHMAVCHGNLSMLRLLLGAGIRPDTRNLADRGATALLTAARLGNREAMQVLLDHGAHPDTQDFEGQAALHAAAERGSAELVEMLLEARASPNVANIDGITPMHVAAELGHASVVAMLRSRGAATFVRDLEGDTPLFYAVRAGVDTSLLRAAAAELRAAASPKEALAKIPLLGQYADIVAQLSTGASSASCVDAVNDAGETVIALALSLLPTGAAGSA